MPENNNNLGGSPTPEDKLTPNFSAPENFGLPSAPNLNGEPSRIPSPPTVSEPVVSPIPKPAPVYAPIPPVSPAQPMPPMPPRPPIMPPTTTPPTPPFVPPTPAPLGPRTPEPAGSPVNGGESTVRTMAGDLSTLKSAGGFVSEAPKPSGMPAASSKPFSGPEKPVDLSSFSSASIFTPGKDAASPKSKEVSPKLLWIIIGIIATAAILAVVYIVVILPGRNAVKTPLAVAPVAVVPQTPAATTTPAAVPPVHQSYLILSTSTPASTLALANLDLTSLMTALGQIKFSGSAKAIQEFSLTYQNNLVDPTELMSLALPEATSTVFGTNFEKDLTGFLYADGAGDIFPGYIFRLNASSTVSGTQKEVSAVIESSPNLTNFYLVSPGKESASGFISATLPNGNKVRSVKFGSQGYVFEYGWVNNYLILSTSYHAILEAESLLQP